MDSLDDSKHSGPPSAMNTAGEREKKKNNNKESFYHTLSNLEPIRIPEKKKNSYLYESILGERGRKRGGGREREKMPNLFILKPIISVLKGRKSFLGRTNETSKE